ncbi:MAG: AI-2E family transporter [Armatimonadetes bacterium]|nr:AI-2E family transporter [Armatimonadota bacterium]
MIEPGGLPQPGRETNVTALYSRESELYRVLSRILHMALGFVLLFWLLDEILLGLMFGVTAVLLATALNPPVVWLEDRGVPRVAGALAICFAIFAVLVLLLALVIPPLLHDAKVLLSRMPEYLSTLQAWAMARLAAYPEVQEDVRQMDFDFVAERALPALGSFLTGAGILSLSLVGLMLFALILSVTVLFILAHPQPLIHGYLTAMPERLRDPAARAFAKSSEMVSRWLLSNVIVGAIEGIAAGVFLSVMGIPGAILWGVFTFFSEQVPKLGPYIMSIPPVIVAFVVSPVKGFWVLIFYFLLNQFTGLLIGPLIRSQQMKLHPASLIFAVIVMASAFGILGALIATPIAGIIKAHYEEFYLSRQPNDPRLDERVDHILRGKAEPG